MDDFKKTQQQLGTIGPGMCLAKWYDSSIHLESGHCHSCVHPRTHKIPIEEIKQNINALHNSAYKKQVRAQMLNQQRPEECQYCWNMEDLNKDLISDRIIFSNGYTGRDSKIIEKVKNNGADADVYPYHLEISFSITCNFKCTYCGPEVSSRWLKEIETHGPMPVSFQNQSLDNIKNREKWAITDREYNPYIEAFWKWLPDAYSSLGILRVTGGEPLLSKHTFKLIDWVKDNSNPSLSLGINTNLNVPEKLIDNFINSLQTIKIGKDVRELVIWSSGEATDEQCDYIRFGMNYQQWYRNCVRLLTEVPGSILRLMTTYSALSTTTYIRFIDDMASLKKQFPNRIIFDSHNYLKDPTYLAVDILTEDFGRYIDAEIDRIKELYNSGIFEKREYEISVRMQQYFYSRLQNPDPFLNSRRKNFYRYFTELDRRRGTNFLKTFPEFADFFELCKNLTL